VINIFVECSTILRASENVFIGTMYVKFGNGGSS